MDVCQLINLYMELWDNDVPIGRLQRVIQHLGIGSAAVAVAVAALNGAGAGSSRTAGVLAAWLLLLQAVVMVIISVFCVVARRPAGAPPPPRCRLALAVARASVAPFLLLLLAGLNDGREVD
uniref:Uncharacterized protein n=1 Tax=Leersia perrieri TaxID=77586 RepID=A0A0D9X526_9ORYZ